MSQTSTPATGEIADEALPRPTRFADVKGWFWPVDQLLFDWFLSYQRDTDPDGRGDLLELGAYLGKSAIFTGRLSAGGGGVHGLRPVGLAGTGRLQQRGDGPVVLDADEAGVRGELSVVPRRTAHDGAGAHLRDHLPGAARGAAASCMSTRRICTSTCTATSRRRRRCCSPEGIVSFDDFRAEHCPGRLGGGVGRGGDVGPEADRDHGHEAVRHVGRPGAGARGAADVAGDAYGPVARRGGGGGRGR